MNLELITKYHPNGQKEYEGYYDETEPVGDHTAWYENGNKEFENNGAVLNNHVTIVRDLLENEVELSKYLIKGQDFVSTLKPK